MKMYIRKPWEIIAAIAACLTFSYRTENSDLYLTLIWKWFDGDSDNTPIGFKNFKGGIKTLKKMRKDVMNWILLLGALSIVISFWILFV